MQQAEKKAANSWEHLITAPNVAPKLDAARLVTPCASLAGRNAARGKAFAVQIKRVIFYSSPGLFADGFARSLRSIGAYMDVRLCSVRHIEPATAGCDLAVLDAEACTDLAATMRALRAVCQAPIAVMTPAHDDSATTLALSLGAATVVSKGLGESQVLDALRRVLESGQIVGVHAPGALDQPYGQVGMQQGNPYGLTPGELDVLRLLAEGMTNHQIAEHRGSKEGTVKIHLDKIYKKLKVQNRTQAMCIAVRMEAVRDLQLREIERGGFRFESLIPYVTHELRRPGDVLFRRGERSDSLFYIRSGRVRLAEFDVCLEDGGLLGEIGIFSPGHARTCTAMCETPTSLFRLSSEQAERLYIENPRFAYHVVKLIAARLIADQNRQEAASA